VNQVKFLNVIFKTKYSLIKKKGLRHMSVKKGAFVAMEHADSLPNGGNTPEKKTNKRVKVSKSKIVTKLESRRAD
jgi:hypothetical protein